MDRVKDGSIQITDEDFPSFLYENETLYDKDNEDIGLFHSYLLVRVYRHIFTAPTSAMNTTAKANKSTAKKFKLTQVTGRTITYASVQVRHLFSHCFLINYHQAYIALLSMSQWGSSDNCKGYCGRAGHGAEHGTSRGSKVFRLLCNTNLNKNIPSRGSKEERIRILLRVWANIQGNGYNK